MLYNRVAEFAIFFDIDNGVGLGLNLLDNFAAFTDDSSDAVLGYLNLHYARNKRFVVFAGLADGSLDDVHYMHASGVSLCECFGEHLV